MSTSTRLPWVRSLTTPPNRAGHPAVNHAGGDAIPKLRSKFGTQSGLPKERALT